MLIGYKLVRPDYTSLIVSSIYALTYYVGTTVIASDYTLGVMFFDTIEHAALFNRNSSLYRPRLLEVSYSDSDLCTLRTVSAGADTLTLDAYYRRPANYHIRCRPPDTIVLTSPWPGTLAAKTVTVLSELPISILGL
jgi:hypothetical protein